MAQESNSPWDIAIRGLGAFLPIPNDIIQEYFKSQKTQKIIIIEYYIF